MEESPSSTTNLFVCEAEQDSVPELILIKHPVQLIPGLVNSFSIVAIHHEDEALGVLEVVPPQGPDLVLTTDIPNCETAGKKKVLFARGEVIFVGRDGVICVDIRVWR